MPDSKMYNVSENFSVNELINSLTSAYQLKGYQVQQFDNGGISQITVSRNLGGIHTISGLGEKLTLSFAIKDNRLLCNTSDEQWTDKIVAFFVGWFCCAITWITGGVGIYRQITLKQSLDSDINMFVMSK